MSDTLPIETLMEVICAVHLASYVDAPFKEHGGLILVGPPGVMKTTAVEVLDRNYAEAIVLSDVNVRTLADYRDQIASETIRTLVFSELGKIYERNPDTARNVEGTIRSLVAEGFTAASFEDQRVQRLRARCTVIGAMTPTLYAQNFRRWEETGLTRRFLWALVRLKNPQALIRAVEDWKALEFRLPAFPAVPPNALIPNTTTQGERAQLPRLVKYQPGAGVHSVQVSLLVRVLAVLKWWYATIGRPTSQALAAVHAFGATLTKNGAQLVLHEPKRKAVGVAVRAHRREPPKRPQRRRAR